MSLNVNFKCPLLQWYLRIYCIILMFWNVSLSFICFIVVFFISLVLVSLKLFYSLFICACVFVCACVLEAWMVIFHYTCTIIRAFHHLMNGLTNAKTQMTQQNNLCISFIFFTNLLLCAHPLRTPTGICTGKCYSKITMFGKWP